LYVCEPIGLVIVSMFAPFCHVPIHVSKLLTAMGLLKEPEVMRV